MVRAELEHVELKGGQVISSKVFQAHLEGLTTKATDKGVANPPQSPKHFPPRLQLKPQLSVDDIQR